MTQRFFVAGLEVHPVHKSGMWRVTVGELHFCSQSQEGLQGALASHHHTLVQFPDEPKPRVDPAQPLIETLKTGTLPERQSAVADLRQLAIQGSAIAQAALSKLAMKPPPSREAANYARLIGKDFSEITHAELTQHVNNVVLRNKLIEELSKRVSL